MINKEPSFEPTEEVYVEMVFSDGWAMGANTTNGQEGLFPADFLAINGTGGVAPGIEIQIPTRTVSAGQSASRARAY